MNLFVKVNDPLRCGALLEEVITGSGLEFRLPPLSVSCVDAMW